MEDAVVALRRDAVEALVREEELRSQLAVCRERAGAVEREAAWAFARGEERLGLQVLYRELPVLGRQDLLQLELVEARRRVIRLLKDAARLDDRARRGREGGES
jgi:phage shock protein A